MAFEMPLVSFAVLNDSKTKSLRAVRAGNINHISHAFEHLQQLQWYFP